MSVHRLQSVYLAETVATVVLWNPLQVVPPSLDPAALCGFTWSIVENGAALKFAPPVVMLIQYFCPAER